LVVANDANRGAREEDRRAVGERRTHLDLDLVLDGESVSGRLALAGAEPRPFSGYAGLIAAVESLRADLRTEREPRPEPQEDGGNR
jgi:hypothetical protein